MSGKGKRRMPGRRAPIIVGIILIIIIGIPLVVFGLSFIGRITPDSILPDSFDFYASAPDPAVLAGKLLNHEPLPDIMALAELAPVIPLLNQVKSSGLVENKFVRYAAKGRLDAAFLSGGRLLGAWDMGIMAPILRFLPALAGRVTVPGLYYVQAGKNSRFEYRQTDGTVFFIGPYKNLLVISNNSALYESVISGASREGDRYGSQAKKFSSNDYDIAFLISAQALKNMMGGGTNSGGDQQSGDQQSADLVSAVDLLQFPGAVEALLTVLPDQLKLRLSTPLGASSPALQKIIERNSRAASVSAMVPENAQYLTLLSAGSLKELLSGASAIAAGTARSGEWENTLKKADNSAKMTVGMDLEELLFSWTGSEFAVFGLEGRPNPVIVIAIKDEQKRKEVFDRAFKSIFLSENIQLNLDGNRIPRIQIPPFLNSFLEFLDIHVPSPYYTVQNNYLFISESAETLLLALNAVRRNEVLPKTELWKTLSGENSGPSSFTLFYSLDRSLPFFLKGQGAVTAVLRLYRQGIAQLTIENKVLDVSLSVIPGEGKGLVPLPGYPLDIGSAGGRTGNRLYRILTGKDSRLLLTRGNGVSGAALAVNPVDRSIREMSLSGSSGASFYAIPAGAENSVGSANSGEGAAWVVSSQGQVSLVNKDMENLKNFPITTGIKQSSPPAAWGEKLYLSGEDGSLYTVDSKLAIKKWGSAFSSPLRSPPSFLDFKNNTYAAVYPKSFFGQIFILDAAGNPLPSWPVSVSGIAFGSPLLFSSQYPGKTDRLFAAFITQPGELTVYSENAGILPGFPRELDGVFYLQPVFDGESLWVIESEGTLYRIDLSGEIFSQKIPRLSVKEGGFITTADIDGDGKGEVFFSGDGNALYGYSRNFSSLEGFPLPVWGKPVFADLNGDGKTEAAGMGMDNKLYMWQFR